MAWLELHKTWHDTDVDHCDVCGNLIIHRYWAFDDVDGVTLRACREDDERLYHRLRHFEPLIEAARAATGTATTARPREAI
ncbi:MAG: hypothetical protein LH650_06040 [Chloroflexi bacterium]|nr:hypothetical protein [Chloroflexota bacterium]